MRNVVGVEREVISGAPEHLLGYSPPPGEHLGFFWRIKKDPVFSPAAANETLHVLTLFLKLGK
jgi:hypothetical protein